MALVAKPAGPTSHDVVDIVRRALGTRRVGHLGTLDPFAEGLLVVVVGRATRLATFASGWTKTYEGVIRLGVTTDTDDATGAVTGSAPAAGVTAAQVAAAVRTFRGEQLQRPPAYSAVKIAGERAYRRARRGEVVEPAARTVDIRELEVTDFTAPAVRFRATVSGGTYLRSLARDIGAALGCGGHLERLRRTAVGPFGIADAVAPDAVTAAQLRDSAVLVADLPRRELTAEERDAVVHGRPLPTASGALKDMEQGAGVFALFAAGHLVAVAAAQGDILKSRVVVAVE